LRRYKIFDVKFPDGWIGQLGLEPSIDLFLDHLMLVMAEVWRVLRDDGICFANLADTYNTTPGGYHPTDDLFDRPSRKFTRNMRQPLRTKSIKPKSLCLVPQKFAIRCQEAGWIVRSEIIWHKPNPMPESCKDRPTRAHEQVWMLTKQGKYFFDQEAVAQPQAEYERARRLREKKQGHKAVYALQADGKTGQVPQSTSGVCKNVQARQELAEKGTRNIRTVWTIASEPSLKPHFATWPSRLTENMVRAGSKKGDIVLDPFAGTGTTVLVAEKLGRIGVGLDLSSEYLWDIAKEKIEAPMQREIF
jgi:DNA modification methylase